MKTSHRLRSLIASGATIAVLLCCLLPAMKSSQAVPVRENAANSPSLLRLDFVDDEGKPVAVRFSLTVDGKAFEPEMLNEHGLRFVSVHESKKQVYSVFYSRGTGTVEVPLPVDARSVEVRAARGFEFLPASQTCLVNKSGATVARIAMRRWINLTQQGWLAADAHLHYDRLAPEDDSDWLTMLDADGLSHAFFMVLKGGKVPGIWARQHAYGKAGEATDGSRRLVSGEEYRDSAMGHINLLGLSQIIQPISTGGLGEPKVHVNWPPLLDVMKRSRDLGGLSGVAHGGSLGRNPTATVDTVLGAVDFFEIGNAHLYSIDLWYRLLNCGYYLPPAAGTDLPNYPFRDAWQPFLGSMRMYVRTGGRNDFPSWKNAVRQGEVFVTSGPLLEFTVDGRQAGGIVRLPAGGGEVVVDAEMASPQPLHDFELVQSGNVLNCEVTEETAGAVHRRQIRKRLRIENSCWLAVRGRGVPIRSLKASIQREAPWVETDAVAHSGIVRVIVDDHPIRSESDITSLITLLRNQQQYYRTQARYSEGRHRLRMQDLFEQAIEELRSRAED